MADPTPPNDEYWLSIVQLFLGLAMFVAGICLTAFAFSPVTGWQMFDLRPLLVLSLPCLGGGVALVAIAYKKLS